MELKEFANAVLAAVREKADGVFSAWITTVTKNNGVKLTGISTVSLGSSGGLCVYLDGYYKAYRQGEIGVNSAAEEIYRQTLKHRGGLKDINTADFLQWDVIKHHIYAKLVNAEWNKEELGTMPHRLFLDLAVVYYIKIDSPEKDRTMSMIIRNPYMELWGHDEERLYQTAAVNMRLNRKPLFENMETILHCIAPEGINLFSDTDIKMYVLTNRAKTFGATEIMDAHTLQAIGKMLADDFIVIPSSVHETIIVPADNAPEYSELADMVCEINATHVDAKERLSNHIYRYYRNEGRLRIAA